MDMNESRPLDFPIGHVGKLSRAVRSRGYRQFAEVAEADERCVSPSDLSIDPERAWAIREKCIALLANRTPHLASESGAP
jgi:hypothetical protein